MEKIRLTIVDDHELFRKGFISMLGNVEDFVFVGEAGNGLELLENFKTTLPDILLLDLNMPVMDGIKTADVVREQHPDVKIIVISMYEEDRFVLHMLEKGVNGYLLKDSSPEEVEKAIRTVFSEGNYYSDFVSKAMHRKFVGKMNSTRPVVFHNGIEVELSAREKDVLQLLCEGFSNQDIADKLFISSRTVDGHRQRIIEKTGAKNIAQAIAFAFKNHLI